VPLVALALLATAPPALIVGLGALMDEKTSCWVRVDAGFMTECYRSNMTRKWRGT